MCGRCIVKIFLAEGKWKKDEPKITRKKIFTVRKGDERDVVFHTGKYTTMLMICWRTSAVSYSRTYRNKIKEFVPTSICCAAAAAACNNNNNIRKTEKYNGNYCSFHFNIPILGNRRLCCNNLFKDENEHTNDDNNV